MIVDELGRHDLLLSQLPTLLLENDNHFSPGLGAALHCAVDRHTHHETTLEPFFVDNPLPNMFLTLVRHKENPVVTVYSSLAGEGVYGGRMVEPLARYMLATHPEQWSKTPSPARAVITFSSPRVRTPSRKQLRAAAAMATREQENSIASKIWLNTFQRQGMVVLTCSNHRAMYCCDGGPMPDYDALGGVLCGDPCTGKTQTYLMLVSASNGMASKWARQGVNRVPATLVISDRPEHVLQEIDLLGSGLVGRLFSRDATDATTGGTVLVAPPDLSEVPSDEFYRVVVDCAPSEVHHRILARSRWVVTRKFKSNAMTKTLRFLYPATARGMIREAIDSERTDMQWDAMLWHGCYSVVQVRIFHSMNRPVTMDIENIRVEDPLFLERHDAYTDMLKKSIVRPRPIFDNEMEAIVISITEACSGGVSSPSYSRWMMDAIPPSADKCPVCLLEFDDMVSFHPMRTNCGHIVCKECIDQWMRRAGTCPLCRSPMGRCVQLRRNRDQAILPLIATTVKLERIVADTETFLENKNNTVLVVTSFITCHTKLMHLFGDRNNFKCLVKAEKDVFMSRATHVLYTDALCHVHAESDFAAFNAARNVSVRVYHVANTIEDDGNPRAVINRMLADSVSTTPLDDVD